MIRDFIFQSPALDLESAKTTASNMRALIFLLVNQRIRRAQQREDLVANGLSRSARLLVLDHRVTLNNALVNGRRPLVFDARRDIIRYSRQLIGESGASTN